MTLKVNGQLIPDAAIQYELDRLVKFYSEHMSAEQIRGQMDILKRRAKDQAVGTKLLIDEAQRLELLVPPEDIQTVIDEMIEKKKAVTRLEKIIDEFLKSQVEDTP